VAVGASVGVATWLGRVAVAAMLLVAVGSGVLGMEGTAVAAIRGVGTVSTSLLRPPQLTSSRNPSSSFQEPLVFFKHNKQDFSEDLEMIWVRYRNKWFIKMSFGRD
jgi:hypothetical protein